MGLDYSDVMAKAGTAGIGPDHPAVPGLLRDTDKVNAIFGILKRLGLDPGALIGALVGRVLDRRSEVVAPPSPPVPQTDPPESVPVPAPVGFEPLRYEDTEFILAPRYFQPDGNTGRIANKDEYQAVLSGADPMVPGSRLAGDCDIVVNGRERFIEPGSAEAAAVLWDEKDTQRMRWFIEGGDDIVEIHENADGFNPYLKVPRKWEGSEGQTGQLFGIFTFADGRRKETNRMVSVRVKR